MSEVDTIERSVDGPVTLDSLCVNLCALGVAQGMTLLVHSSLSALGWVCGGAQAVVMALEEVLGAQGTLVMPTHSGGLSDPEAWQHPPVPADWWEVIRQTMPAYAPDLSPTRSMGAVVECFRMQQGVLRSNHPHLSFGARGPLAAAITENHGLSYALGEDSPLARLYALDAWVLLLGVGHNNNTSLHLAECRADFSARRTIQAQAPVMLEGRRQWVSFEDVDYDSDDFERIGAAFEEQAGELRIGQIGYGEARLFRQRPLVDYAVKWMEEHRL